MTQIATFYSHFGAIRFKRACDRLGWTAKLMPVPRGLSSSCGTCVRFEADTPPDPSLLTDEAEQVVMVSSGQYQTLYRAENG